MEDKTVEGIIKFISRLELDYGPGGALEVMSEYEQEIGIPIQDLEYLHDALEMKCLQDEQEEGDI